MPGADHGATVQARIHSPISPSVCASRGAIAPRPSGPMFNSMLPPIETESTSICTSMVGDF